MACAEYFEHQIDWDALAARSERVLYGTDFPITPYAYDRELRVLGAPRRQRRGVRANRARDQRHPLAHIIKKHT